jgi:hypothetical protein
MFTRTRPILLIALLLAACSPAGEAATPADTVTGASLSAPSRTPSPSLAGPAETASLTEQPAPSQTAMPEPTAAPPLPLEGPYFAFISRNRVASMLTLLGADGIGRRDILLPESANTGYGHSSLISPDGDWLAYWTGSAGEPSYGNPSADNDSHDLQLNLLHIPDNQIRQVTPLLSPDYPANFEKIAGEIKDLQEFKEDTIGTIVGYLRDSFLDGIRSAAWSPDGRYLAFAGEMDGPSSDLYAYDTVTRSIRRLSWGNRNLVANVGPAMQWSSDGRWIVYFGAYLISMDLRLVFYAARPDGSQSRDFNEEVSEWHDWGSPTAFFVSQGENGVGSYGLRIADLETGTASLIWRCPFEKFVYDPEGRILIFDWSGDLSFDCPNPGLSMRAIPSLETLLFIGLGDPAAAGDIAFLGQGDKRFLASAPAGTYAITSEGKIHWLTHEILEPYISPDRRWIAFAGDGFRLMDVYGNMSEMVSDIPVSDLLWRPNSRGFLIRSGSELYSVGVQGGIVSRIEGDSFPSDLSDHLYFLDYFWQPDSNGLFLKYRNLLYFISFKDNSIHLILDNLSEASFDPIWIAVPE